jgi:uncharacterized membrane protein
MAQRSPYALLGVVALAAPLVAAHQGAHNVQARQASSSAPAVPSSVAATALPSYSGFPTGPAPSSIPTPSVSLLATNPTAVPLSDISSG